MNKLLKGLSLALMLVAGMLSVSAATWKPEVATPVIMPGKTVSLSSTKTEDLKISQIKAKLKEKDFRGRNTEIRLVKLDVGKYEYRLFVQNNKFNEAIQRTEKSWVMT